MKNSLALFSILFVFIALIGCRNEPKQPDPPPASEKLADDLNKTIDEAFENVDGNSEDFKNALKDVVKAVQDNSNENVKIVPFRKMKELLPDKVIGLERTDGEGSTSGALGIKASTYEATYGEGDRQVKIQLVDTGGLGKAIMGAVPWATMEVDKESKDGYERTTEYKGHKAFEKYNERSKSGNLATLVGERFVVNIEGDGLSIDEMERVRSRIDIDQLLRLGAD